MAAGVPAKREGDLRIQLLSGTRTHDGLRLLNRVHDVIWKSSGGILQADDEGFSNEEGSTILWQFPEDARGARKMAVLRQAGAGLPSRWVHFEMDLGDLQQREAFCSGRVPSGVNILQI